MTFFSFSLFQWRGVMKQWTLWCCVWFESIYVLIVYENILLGLFDMRITWQQRKCGKFMVRPKLKPPRDTKKQNHVNMCWIIGLDMRYPSFVKFRVSLSRYTLIWSIWRSKSWTKTAALQFMCLWCCLKQSTRSHIVLVETIQQCIDFYANKRRTNTMLVFVLTYKSSIFWEYSDKFSCFF